jgi:hypothetical protein
MLEELLQQAETTIRKGVRSMEADRLRGDVKVIHWTSIKEVMETALARLQGEVERLAAQQQKPAAAPPPPKAVPGEDLAAKAARLERELAEARKVIAAYELAVDYYDLIEDFDTTKFEAACEALKAKAAKAEQLASKKFQVALVPQVEDMVDRGGRLKDQLTNLMEQMYGPGADLGVLIQIVKLGKDVSFLWQRHEMLAASVDQLTKAFV